MFWSEMKQIYVSVMEDQKKGKARWREACPEEPIQKNKPIKIIRYYFAGEAFLALLVNYYLVDSLDGSGIDFSYVVVGVGYILISMYLKWMFVYFLAGTIKATYTVLGMAFIPGSMTIRYFSQRQDGYREPKEDLELFTEQAWLAFFAVAQVCLIIMWLFPATLLWPATALDLDQSQCLGAGLYLAGFLACAVVWLYFRRAVEGRGNLKQGPALIAWLRNPRSLEDVAAIPLLFAGFFLIFGYLAWPLMDLGIQVMKGLVSAGFRSEGIEYGEIVAVYPREQLLAILDQEKMGFLQGLVLPGADGLERSFGFNLEHFRTVRDAALPHLPPVVLLMTAVLLWMRDRLSRDRLAYAGS